MSALHDIVESMDPANHDTWSEWRHQWATFDLTLPMDRPTWAEDELSDGILAADANHMEWCRLKGATLPDSLIQEALMKEFSGHERFQKFLSLRQKGGVVDTMFARLRQKEGDMVYSKVPGQ
jgi:hypothetical protein